MLSLAEVEARLRATTRANALQDGERVAKSLAALKATAVGQGNEAEAKRLWCLEQVTDAQLAYLAAFVRMKAGAYYKGWCNLEEAEKAVDRLRPHWCVSNNEFGLEFIATHVQRFQRLFPYRVFSSPEILVKEQRCTICGAIVSIRKSCAHEVGEVYGGELCRLSVTDGEVLSVAMVEHPEQKFCVPFFQDKETGEPVDHYNYLLVKYLIQRLKTPFTSWSALETTSRHSHEKFRSVGVNAKCPCGSNTKYKKCCLSDPKGVLMPHMVYNIDGLEGTEERDIEFTYGQFNEQASSFSNLSRTKLTTAILATEDESSDQRGSGVEPDVQP